MKSFDLAVKTIGILLRCKGVKARQRGKITADEYEKAFNLLMKLLQMQYYPEEYRT